MLPIIVGDASEHKAIKRTVVGIEPKGCGFDSHRGQIFVCRRRHTQRVSPTNRSSL